MLLFAWAAYFFLIKKQHKTGLFSSAWYTFMRKTAFLRSFLLGQYFQSISGGNSMLHLAMWWLYLLHYGQNDIKMVYTQTTINFPVAESELRLLVKSYPIWKLLVLSPFLSIHGEESCVILELFYFRYKFLFISLLELMLWNVS